MSRSIFVLAGAAVLGLAACGDSPSAGDSTTLLTDPAELQLYVGDVAPLVSQVITRSGRVEAPGVHYWSQDQRVARVGPDGYVTAVAPGSTVVMSGFQTLLDSVLVTVRRDTRGDLHQLDIIPVVVSGATGGGPVTVPYLAVDGFGRSNCTPPSLSLRFNAAIAAVTNSSWGEACTLTVYPAAEGQGWLVATADGVGDSVRVVVLNGDYHAAFTEASLAVAVVGVPRPISARLLTARGEPVAGRSVRFSASPGLLNQSTGVTDSTGTATVVWTPPTSLAAYGSTGQLSFQTSFPTGVTANVGGTVRIQGSAPTAVEWYRADAYYSGYGYYGFSQILSGSVTIDPGYSPTIFAIGRDVYGNHTALLPQMTYTVLTDTMKYGVARTESTCGANVPSSPSYYACYAGFGFSAGKPGTIRIFATVDGLPRDSVNLVFR